MFFLIFFIKAYIVGTHLNCMDKSMQFKWVPTTYISTQKYSDSNLKTTELLDCALIGVSVAIRAKTVIFINYSYRNNPMLWDREAWANSIDQMLHNMLSDQGLCCLPLIQHCFTHTNK